MKQVCSVERLQIPGGGARIPVVVVRAATAGPTVCVGANLHGDECTGVGVVHALAQKLPTTLERGVVVLYPSLNPIGLEQATRRLPGDGLDPNRAFPGTTRGGRAERHAHRVWSEIISRKPDLYIDLHTDTGGALPYAILDRVVRGQAIAPLARRCRELAAASGLTVLEEYPRDRYLRFELDRSLPGALINGAGVAALTLEVGPRRRICPEAVADATASVTGILHRLGMGGQPAAEHPTRMAGGPWRRESGPRTMRSGILVPFLSPGDSFTKGDRLAEVRSIDGRVLEQLSASHDGFIIALPELAHAEIGTSCATLAIPDVGQ